MMKKLVFTPLLFLCLVLPFFTSGSAHAYSQIISFGDSLSDNGPSDGYGLGVSSNGDVWVDYLAGYLGNPLTNMAYGAAQTNYHPYTSSPVLGFLWQIDHYSTYEAVGGQADPNALYTIWIGGNDLLNADLTNPNPTIAAAVDNIVAGVEQLVTMGAEHILVMNMPDLGATPLNNGNDATRMGGRALAQGFNSILASALAPFDTRIEEFVQLDVLAMMDQFTGYPAGSSDMFDNTADMLRDAGQTTDTFLFWDQIHPTTYAHAQIAQQVLPHLTTPVPGTFLLLGFGLIGILGVRRKQ